MNRIVSDFLISEIGTDDLKELKKLKLAVLCGGSSPEREVSLESGKNAYEALNSNGYNVAIYDLDRRFFEDSLKGKIDAVFILLHGTPGEDGTVQGFLELTGIPYAGSQVAASSVGMDKLLTKALLYANGLPVAKYSYFCFSGAHKYSIRETSLTGKDYETIDELVGLAEKQLPVVVKPARQGSSVGVSIAKSRRELEAAISEASRYDCCIIVEEYLEAREIQCGIIGRKKLLPLPLIEIISKRQFFDYYAKYTPGAAEEIAPAPLSPELTKTGQEIALKAFQALGCRDFARVDMFLTSDGNYFVSEINTIPGMTSNSLLPKEAQALGISYPELIEMIVVPALYEAYLKK